MLEELIREARLVPLVLYQLFPLAVRGVAALAVPRLVLAGQAPAAAGGGAVLFQNTCATCHAGSDPRIPSDKPRGTITAKELLDAGSSRIEQQFHVPSTSSSVVGA